MLSSNSMKNKNSSEKQKLVVFSGAGISAASGLQTFRGSDGMWEEHSIYEVATPQAWHDNPHLVLDFYNARRKQLNSALPNKAHLLLADLESEYTVSIITQNIDNLHEKAGSSQVVHLHGELLKSRSTINSDLIYPCQEDINWGDKCLLGSQLRPHVVWFGEAVLNMDISLEIIKSAEILLIIGTSLQVYPAASLIGFCKSGVPIYYIDPEPSISPELHSLRNQLIIIKSTAADGIKEFVEKIS